MANHRDTFGLSCALVTPFGADGRCDIALFVEHARSRISRGCSSVTVFGTTGEGASIGIGERHAMLAGLKAAGFDFRREVIVCCAASAIEDVVAQIEVALSFDCRAILMPPPFYFKGVADDGLFAWYSACFERVGRGMRDVILYHIPSVTGIPLPPALIERLKRTFPAIVDGVKDSGGDWDYSSALLRRNPDLTILIGDERHLAQSIPLGGGGAISGMSNIVPEVLLRMIESGTPDPRIDPMVVELLRHPVTPGIKALTAHVSGEDGWRAARPPLKALDDGQARALTRTFDTLFGQDLAREARAVA